MFTWLAVKKRKKKIKNPCPFEATKIKTRRKKEETKPKKNTETFEQRRK